MKNVMDTISVNLKAACKAKKIRQVDIAKSLGVSQACVSNWMNGSNLIDIDNLIALCDLIGITLNQVYGVDPINAVVSSDDLELLSLYNSMNTIGKQAAMASMRGIADVDAFHKETIDEADERMLRTAEKIAAEAEDDDSVTTA